MSTINPREIHRASTVADGTKEEKGGTEERGRKSGLECRTWILPEAAIGEISDAVS